MIGCPRRDYMPTATTNRHGSVVVEYDEYPQRLPCRGRLHSGHARAYAGDARNASFERMERPFFPADDDIPLQPTILQ